MIFTSPIPPPHTHTIHHATESVFINAQNNSENIHNYKLWRYSYSWKASQNKL